MLRSFKHGFQFALNRMRIRGEEMYYLFVCGLEGKITRYIVQYLYAHKETTNTMNLPFNNVQHYHSSKHAIIVNGLKMTSILVLLLVEE